MIYHFIYYFNYFYQAHRSYPTLIFIGLFLFYFYQLQMDLLFFFVIFSLISSLNIWLIINYAM